MNVKEMLNGLGTNEWTTIAGSAAAVVGLTWYVKKWLKKKKEGKDMSAFQQVGDEEQFLKMIELYQKAEAANMVSNQGETKSESELILKLLEEVENKKQPSGLNKRVADLEQRVSRMEELLVTIIVSLPEDTKKSVIETIHVEKKQTKTESKAESVTELARLKNEELKDETDGLDPYIFNEIEKIKSTAKEGMAEDFIARLNVIPTILPPQLSVDGIANIREIILFAMMCRNKLSGTTLFIPRDSASDYLVGAHRSVMAILKEEKVHTQQLEHAFSRCFNFLKDDSNFKIDPKLQKKA